MNLRCVGYSVRGREVHFAYAQEHSLACFFVTPVGEAGCALEKQAGLEVQPDFSCVFLIQSDMPVPYVPASAQQVENVMLLLKGRSGKMVDLGSGDGRIVLEAYRRGFRPAVGYELNPWLLRLSNYRAWKAGCYGEVSYFREDLWKVNLSDCTSVTVFLAPSVLPLLERKLLLELPDEARVVAGRFPLPNWTPTSLAGEGVSRAWAYDIKLVRQAEQDKPNESPV
ncbi:adenine nucleotide translocase lysine N-methyltransferase isoform X1 [Hemicordylus capensis]|uniref:adenine nucleotide translocase lysine N-methyltransferase isoform X1 n=1 Tax=Hemicordylus capensis TaxID=884348 RepID=UPI002303C5E2|nr:adenine nucleotide translocase lysine N-methyltransferase isoform X1 [Hemicordylus capensis]